MVGTDSEERVWGKKVRETGELSKLMSPKEKGY
jgi:hypothetical protein